MVETKEKTHESWELPQRKLRYVFFHSIVNYFLLCDSNNSLYFTLFCLYIARLEFYVDIVVVNFGFLIFLSGSFIFFIFIMGLGIKSVELKKKIEQVHEVFS